MYVSARQIIIGLILLVVIVGGSWFVYRAGEQSGRTQQSAAANGPDVHKRVALPSEQRSVIPAGPPAAAENSLERRTPAGLFQGDPDDLLPAFDVDDVDSQLHDTQLTTVTRLEKFRMRGRLTNVETDSVSILVIPNAMVHDALGFILPREQVSRLHKGEYIEAICTYMDRKQTYDSPDVSWVLYAYPFACSEVHEIQPPS